MTMMAETSPALVRLFERIDSAPRPADEKLAAILADWQEKRADAAIPQLEDVVREPRQSRRHATFVFETVADDRRDYALLRGSDSIVGLLGTSEPGMRLKKAEGRRGAVRLRRLFEAVRASSEPLLAQFEMKGTASTHSLIDILIAPLSRDGRSVTGFLGALAVRPIGTHATAPATPPVRNAWPNAPLVFASERDKAFGTAIAHHLGLHLSPLEEREFEDGEHKTRPMVDVRGRETYVVASLNAHSDQSVNDRLCRLLFLIGCLKTNGAARVTAITPYLCYLRKDRQTKPNDPLTGRYVAQLIEAIGADRLITMEAHNLAAFQNAFRIPTIHLDPYQPFATYLARELGSAEVTVVSPDLGGSKRADIFRTVLEEKLGRAVGAAFAEKHRSMGVVSGEMFAGEIAGRAAIILDDMISSGATMARAAKACAERGATGVYLAATHGLFSVDAGRNLGAPYIRKILIADTVQPSQMPARLRDRIVNITVAGLFADAIRSP